MERLSIERGRPVDLGSTSRERARVPGVCVRVACVSCGRVGCGVWRLWLASEVCARGARAPPRPRRAPADQPTVFSLNNIHFCATHHVTRCAQNSKTIKLNLPQTSPILGS